MSDEGLRGDLPAPQHAPTAPGPAAAQHAGGHPQPPVAQHAGGNPQPPAAQHAGGHLQPPAAQQTPSPLRPPHSQHAAGRVVGKAARAGRRGIRLAVAGGAAAALAAVVFVAVRKADPPSARPQAPATGSNAAVTEPVPPKASSALAGSVESRGETTLPFTAKAGTVSYFAAAAGCTANGLQWDVEDVAGTPLGPAADICGDIGRIDFASDGAYRVRVYSVGSGGRGDFSIERKDSRPDKIGAITAGATMFGDIDLPGARDIYEFDASAGTVAWFTSPACSTSDLQWAVEDQAGTPVGPAAVVCGQVGRISFETTGRYRVRVYSVNGGTGTYSIAWQKSRPDRYGRISGGQTISGEIDLPGAHDVYDFKAVADTVAYFAAAGASCVDNGAYWVVENSADVAQSATAAICGDIGRVEFSASGTYRLRVYSVSGGVGSYEVRWLVSRQDAKHSLSIGATAHGNIDLPGSRDVWTFRAVAGETVRFSASAGCTSTELVWTVQTPEGTAIAPPSVLCNDIGDVTFPEAGDYQVVITGGGQTTAAYSFETQHR